MILYGNSLILEGVRAELAGNSNWEVIMLDQSLHEPLEELRALNPAAIIFDLSAVLPGFPLAMLQQPGLLLIGIDPETHRAQVWSGTQVAAASADNLLAIIQKYGEEKSEPCSSQAANIPEPGKEVKHEKIRVE